MNYLKCKEVHGFESDIHMGILVTADANAFLSYEVHQPYVDGGLFSMSLIYAIHAVGLGCIPLSCGFYKSKLDQIKKEYDVPNNEIPIVLLVLDTLKIHSKLQYQHVKLLLIQINTTTNYEFFKT